MSDMNMIKFDVKLGSEKFGEEIDKGGGCALTQFAKNRSRAHAIKTIKNNPNIPITYDDGEFRAMSPAEMQRLERAELYENHVKLVQQENREKVIEMASNQFEEDEMVSGEPADQDKIRRILGYAGDVSDEEIQVLWAKILAGEIKNPGAFSFRALQTLCNLSKEEALKFIKLSRYAFIVDAEYCFLPHDDYLFDEKLITFSDLILMDECGLISSMQYHLNPKITKDQRKIFIRSNKVVGHISSDIGRSFKIGTYKYTNSGHELFRVICPQSDYEYGIQYLKWLKKENMGFKVTAQEISKINNDGSLYCESLRDILMSITTTR